VHGSPHPSAPLASIPCCQLNVNDTRSSFVYGKGTGQCHPEPVVWSAYLALCITVTWISQGCAHDLKYPDHQDGPTSPVKPAQANDYII
jgi:hypothetical protein